jgi:hypothetical protein
MLEYDFDNPAHRQRRRPPPPLEGEILPSESEPRIRVTVEHRHVNHRQRQHIPPWAIAMLIVGALCWLSPFGLIVGFVLISVFLAMHPGFAIVLGVTVALVIIIAFRERLAGRRL